MDQLGGGAVPGTHAAAYRGTDVAVVIGSGLAGLATAQVLSLHFQRVVVFGKPCNGPLSADCVTQKHVDPIDSHTRCVTHQSNYAERDQPVSEDRTAVEIMADENARPGVDQVQLPCGV